MLLPGAGTIRGPLHSMSPSVLSSPCSPWSPVSYGPTAKSNYKMREITLLVYLLLIYRYISLCTETTKRKSLILKRAFEKCDTDIEAIIFCL